jgi:sugar phosphate isomerase/epimerase
MRLGISSYTYVWAVGVPGYPQPQSPLTVLDLLAKATELGVSVLQIADNLPLDRLPARELDRLAAQAAERRITIEAGTCGIRPPQLRTYLDIAVRLRSPILRVVIDTTDFHPSPDEVVGLLGEVLPEFERAGVCLAVENHDRFPAATLATIVERCDSDHLGIVLDTANSLGCGEDVHTVLRSLGLWVVNLHVKDFSARRMDHRKGFIIEGCPAGQGLVDIPRLLDELRGLARDPNVILELWPPPEASIEASIAKEETWTRQSIDYLRQFVTQ